MSRVFTLAFRHPKDSAGRMAVGTNKHGRNETFPRETSILQIAERLNPFI
jgi:hypothetical protein